MARDFILFKDGPLVRALLVPGREPGNRKLQLLGVFYNLTNVYLGDFNHLLDNDDRLVGVEFSYWENAYPGLRKSPLVNGTQSAVIEANGDLRLWLSDVHTAKSDLSQAIGGEIFIGREDVVLIIPEVTEWPVSTGTGFELLNPESVGFRFC